MKGLRERKWHYLDDWNTVFGTEVATGRRSKAFGEACKKILASDRLEGNTSADLEFGYNLNGDDVEDSAVDQPNNPKERSHIPDICEGNVVPKRRKLGKMAEADAQFLEMMNGFINSSKEALVSIRQPSITENTSTVAAVGGVDDEFKRVAVELDRFKDIGSTYRVAIGRKLVADAGLRNYFFHLSDEDKVEFMSHEEIGRAHV